MSRSSRWLLFGILILVPLSGVFAQVATYQFHADTTYRELNPANTDGCALPPYCHYHPGMETWGNDSPMKEYCYTGKDAGGNVVEFMNWRILYPVGFSAANPTKYPMIIMLHGSGESGRLGCCGTNWAPNNVKYDNNDMQVQHGGKEHQIACGYSYTTGLPSGPVNWPGIVIWPQSSYNAGWEGGWNNGVLANDGRMATIILDYIIKTPKFNVDPDRISIHGLSNGAQGAWDVAAKRPDLFAAFLPMSGVATNYPAQTDVLVTTPIWQFQGGLDTNPNPQASLDLYNMLVAKGGNPKYTLYPNLAHGTWTTAYAEPDFFPFMLRANKKNIYVFGGDPSICPGGSLKLGFSAGYASYQWTLNGVDIAGANSRYYNVTAPGDYAVRFTRVTDGSTGLSYTKTVLSKSGSTNFAPTLTNTGSVQLPISNGLSPGGNLGGVNNVILISAPLGYTSYNFFKNGVSYQNSSSNTLPISNNNGASGDSGAYTATVLMATGCTSDISNAINVVWNNPQPTTNIPSTPVPTNVSGSATTMNVTWLDVSGETGYEVWRWRFGSNGYSIQNWALVTVLPSSNTTPVTFIDHGLRPNGMYQYKVRAIYGATGATFSGDSNWSTENLDVTPPTAPTNLIASNITETQATLTWSPASDNDLVYKYEVYNGSTLITTLTGGTEGSPLPVTTYTLSGLAPNMSYILSVRAIDYSNNYSPMSDPVTATTTIFGNGLNFKYYTYTGTMPGSPGAQLVEPRANSSFDFTQTPAQSGIVTNFSIAGANTYQGTSDPNNFVYAFDGYIQITTAGTYRFYTDSDDGSRLYIDGSLIVNNDGAHGTGTPKSGATASLAVGKHSIRVTYFEQTGGQSLSVRYNTPSSTNNYSSATVIPNSVLFLSGTSVTNYYLVNTASPDPAQFSAWTTNANGSAGGSAPSNFTAPLQYFTIANQSSVTLGSAWTVSGSGSKVIVGDNTNAITLVINGAFTGSMDAKKNTTISVNNATMPAFGVLDPTSIVNFNVAGNLTIPNALYGNVNFQSANQYTFPLSTTTIQGNLAVVAGATTMGIANNLSTLRIGGDLSFANTANPLPATSAQQYSLAFTGGKTHTISFATSINPALFALQADFGDNIVFSNSGTHTYAFGSAQSQGGGLTLRGGSTLNIGGNNLNVTGLGSINPNNENGVIAINGGDVNLNTTAIQNSNVYFSNVSNQYNVNNFTASAANNTRISVATTVNINNLVTLNGGELNSNSGAITLVSNGSGTARIGPLANGAKITGTITAQRYMPLEAAGKIYRYISSPVIGLTAATLQQYIPITGNFTGASTGTGLGTSSSMFSYTEPPNGPGYVAFPASGGTNQDTLRRGKGYAIYVREPTNPTTWVATGTPNQGTIPFTLTPGTAAPNDGWNLLGNPYPSPIKWDGTGTTSTAWPVMTNINPTVYVRHNFGAQYQWYVYRQGIVAGDLLPGQAILTNGVIAPGQAFWVMVDASPSMSVSENAKWTTDGNFYRTATARAEDTPDVLTIRMSNNTYNDIAYIMHNDLGTENYEKRQDAVKQRNSFFNLSTRSKDGISLAINVTPKTFCQKDVLLDIENAKPGDYTLGFFGIEKFRHPVTAMLKDNFMGTTTEIKEGSKIDFAVTTDPTSTGAGRFVLTEKPIVLTNASLKTNSVCESNPVITLLKTQTGVQYQALFNGGAVSDPITSNGEDLKLTLDRKSLGYGMHTVNLIAGFKGCDISALDQTISVSVDTLQTPAIAYQSGGFLAASPANADQYQWLFDGNPLTGKTQAILKDNNALGNYQVRVSSGACTKVSKPFEVAAAEGPSSSVKAYPNPFRDQIVVTLPEKFHGGTVTLINPVGQSVQSVSIAPQDSYDVTLNFAGVEAGPYVLSVGRYKFKVIKIN